MLRNGAWWAFVLAVALASCSTLFWREGLRITSPKPFSFFPLLFPWIILFDVELKARAKKPDQGYFPRDDSLMRDGWPKIRSTYPQTTLAPSLVWKAHKKNQKFLSIKRLSQNKWKNKKGYATRLLRSLANCSMNWGSHNLQNCHFRTNMQKWSILCEWKRYSNMCYFFYQ